MGVLKRDVELREILDSLDVGRLRALVAEEPDLASTTMEHWGDHPAGASPLGYVARLRYDTTRGIWRDWTATRWVAGWRGRIRTFDLLIQSQAPYRLATRQ
jgi:uncharacterized protein